MRCATVSSSSENTCVHCVVNSIGVYRNLHPRPPVSRAPPCKYLIQPVSIKCSIIFIYENAIGEQMKEETNQRNIVYCVPMRTYPLILLHLTLINSPFFCLHSLPIFSSCQMILLLLLRLLCVVVAKLHTRINSSANACSRLWSCPASHMRVFAIHAVCLGVLTCFYRCQYLHNIIQYISNKQQATPIQWQRGFLTAH